VERFFQVFIAQRCMLEDYTKVKMSFGFDVSACYDSECI